MLSQNYQEKRIKIHTVRINIIRTALLISNIDFIVIIMTLYREGYIESMSEHVNIHIYGNCGAPCPADSPLGCLQYLARSEFTNLNLTPHTSHCPTYLDLKVTPYTSLLFFKHFPIIPQRLILYAYPAPGSTGLVNKSQTINISLYFFSFLFFRHSCCKLAENENTSFLWSTLMLFFYTFLNFITAIGYFASAKLMPIYT